MRHTNALVLHSIPLDTSQRDIRVYLQGELSRIAQSFELGSWPPMDVLAHLVEQSCGLFIFAATVVHFIEDQDACNAIFGALLSHPKVIKSPDLTKLVRAFALGKNDEDELSTETGLPITRIYQLRRELREIRPTISAKLKKEGVMLA